MIKTEYTRKINKSSLLIMPEKEYEEERDSIGMFRYNEIPYFLKMEAQRTGAGLKFCYDITGKRSLEQLLEYQALDYALLQLILKAFDQACTQTGEYMMTENDILLEPEFVFADHSADQISYCYLPGNQKDICRQFKKFMEYLLPYLDHNNEQAMQLAYGVYQQVVEERTALHLVLEDERQSAEWSWPVMQESELSKNLTKEMPDNEYERQMSQIRCSELQNQTNEGKESQIIREQCNKQQYQQNKGKESQLPGSGLHDSRNQQNEKKECGFHTSQNRSNEPELPFVQNRFQENQSFQHRFKEQQFHQQEQQFHQQEQQFHRQEQQETENLKGNGEEIEKIKQKVSIRMQAAEKLKKMLRKKIYTDKSRYMEDEAVFETDEEEEVCNNPTVCLVSETDEIQNQFVYQGTDRSRDFYCLQGKMLLGSDAKESDIYIPFPMISRIHARIEIGKQGIFLEDLNSTNGTLVNGELLQYREKRLLQKGDLISLAGECYSFH